MISTPRSNSGLSTNPAQTFAMIQALIQTEINKYKNFEDPAFKIAAIEMSDSLELYFGKIASFPDVGTFNIEMLINANQTFLRYLLRKQEDRNFPAAFYQAGNNFCAALTQLTAKLQELITQTVPVSLSTLTIQEQDIYAKPPMRRSCCVSESKTKFLFMQPTEEHLFAMEDQEGRIIVLNTAYQSYKFKFPSSINPPMYVCNNHYNTGTAMVLTEAGEILKIKLTSQPVFPQYDTIISIKNVPTFIKIFTPKLFWHEKLFAVNCQFNDLKAPEKALLFYKSTAAGSYILYQSSSISISPFITLASVNFPNQPNNIILLNQYDDFFVLDVFNFIHNKATTSYNITTTFEDLRHGLTKQFSIKIINDIPLLLFHNEILTQQSSKVELAHVHSARFSPVSKQICLTIGSRSRAEMLILLNFDETLAVNPIFRYIKLDNQTLVGEVIFSPNGKYIFALTEKIVDKTSTFGIKKKTRCFLSCFDVEDLQLRTELQIEENFKEHLLKSANISTISWQFLKDGKRLILLTQMEKGKFTTLLYLFDFVAGLPLSEKLAPGK